MRKCFLTVLRKTPSFCILIGGRFSVNMNAANRVTESDSSSQSQRGGGIYLNISGVNVTRSAGGGV